MALSVEEVQSRIRAGAERLDALRRELDIGKLMNELEELFPVDLDPMWKDDECPSVAYEVHGGLAHLTEHLERASEIMRCAADRTPEASLDDWKKRLLETVKEPSSQALFRYLLTGASPPEPARE